MRHPLASGFAVQIVSYSGNVVIERDFGGASMQPGYWVVFGDDPGLAMVARCQMDDFGNLVRLAPQ